MSKIDLKEWQREIESDLKNNILSFWQRHTVDHKHGGFVGEITGAMEIKDEANKGLVLHARIMWTYAIAYRKYHDPAYLELAERAYHYLYDHFWDTKYGGLYWMIEYEGKPIQAKKQVYGEAFVIYALAEYVRAVPNQEALDRAIALFELLEKYAHDPIHGGYIEALSRDWQETTDNSLSTKDLNERKSMNTHLHVMEAYTNLYRVWPSERLKQQLGEIIRLTIEHILDPSLRHFNLFFDDAWTVKSDEISYGHDIEGSWLLLEAAEVLGNAELLERAEKAAVTMADATYKEGLDTSYGGLFNETKPDKGTDTDKHWWPQAEAVVGFLNAYQMTGEGRYLQASYDVWRFIDRCIIDKVNGEWFWKTDREGNPASSMTKVDPWKCPYHNGRMGFELLERFPKL